MKLVTTLILLALSVPALAADYVVDKEGQHAYIIFKASHLGYSYIIGHFEDFDGSFTHDAQDPSKARVAVNIRTASLDSDHAERDKHLKGSDYLDVGKYPNASFVSTGYEGTGTEGKLKGNLELRGISKEITIDVKQIGEGKDPWGGYRSGFEGSVTLQAADFGLPAWIGAIEMDLILEGVRQ